jgi:RNA polymerase-binding protein DksA
MKKPTPLKKSDLAHYKKSLLSLRQRLAGDVSQLANEAMSAQSGNLSSVPMHMADVGSDAYNQEFTLELLENEQEALQQIDDALGRLERGKFGLCEECSKEILRERLDVLPFTPYCVECARKLEQRP